VKHLDQVQDLQKKGGREATEGVPPALLQTSVERLQLSSIRKVQGLRRREWERGKGRKSDLDRKETFGKDV